VRYSVSVLPRDDNIDLEANELGGKIGRANPVMPEGIYNWKADNWSPLLAIADTAGGDWPEQF
jgi:Protein of unknown function (DUF3631)